MFIATKCPYSNAYNDRMKKMADEYAAKGVQFVGINSNVSEPADEVQKQRQGARLRVPLMKDPGNKVADMYDARRTPEVFVVDAQGKVRYHGRIDENYEDASKVTSPDLRNALDALLAGQQVKNTETKAFGCTIKRA
jgi:peroxiredoxin